MSRLPKNRSGLEYSENPSVQRGSRRTQQTGPPHEILPYAFQVRDYTAGFFDTRNQRGNIPGIHDGVDSRIDAALGNERVLDAITDEAKLARSRNERAQLVTGSCWRRDDIGRIRAAS